FEESITDSRGIDPWLRDFYRTFADARSRIFEAGQHVFIVETVQSGQRPQRVQTCLWDPAAPHHAAQRLHRGWILTLEQKTLRGFTPPRVWIFQRGHEFGGARAGELRPFWCLETRWCQSPDAAPFAATFQIDCRMDVVGNAPGVLDDF